MKRLFTILIIILSSLSCSKKENSLVGTKWETDGFGPLMETLFGYKYHVYEFIDDKSVDSYWLDKNGKIVSYDTQCEYTIAEPYVTIKHEEDDVRKLEMTNKMTMVVTTNTSIKYFIQK